MSNRATTALVTLWPYAGRYPNGQRKRVEAHLYREVIKQRYEVEIGTLDNGRSVVIPLGRAA